jgi:O-antigen ligase
MISYQGSIDKIYQYLLIVAFFFLPLAVSPNNIAIWLIMIIWLLSGNYKNKFNQVFQNKLALASMIFFGVHCVALLWTENISWGLEITRKMLPFLIVLPVLLTITRKENIKFYIGAFLLAISISETITYLIWFEVIESFKYAKGPHNPTALVSHISYNPLLAFAIYLVAHRIFFEKKKNSFETILYSFFLATMSINMFITGGRAGQIMFFAAIIIIFFQYFKNSKIKAVISSSVLIFVLATAAFNYSPLFKSRVLLAVEDVVHFDGNSNTSIGQRVTFAINSYELFKRNPIIGIGTGDFPDEYKKVNLTNSPNVINTVQPHNMYMLILSQLGLFGFASFMMIFYYQFLTAINAKNSLVRNIGIALPLLFLLIMWSDSYLLGHYTGNLFILFSSFIYSNNING